MVGLKLMIAAAAASRTPALVAAQGINQRAGRGAIAREHRLLADALQHSGRRLCGGRMAGGQRLREGIVDGIDAESRRPIEYSEPGPVGNGVSSPTR